MHAEQQDGAELTTATSSSLLEALKTAQHETAWQQFVDRYRPLIVSYARNNLGLNPQDAEDAAQAALIAFCEAYRKGDYDPEKGRLRNWLFGIATRQLKNAVRKRARIREVQVADPSSGTGFIDRIPDDAQLEESWEEEWRQAVLRQGIAEVRGQFDARTVEAFQRFALDDVPAQQVADQLGMTRNAVFLAKHRVLKRLREIMAVLEETW